MAVDLKGACINCVSVPAAETIKAPTQTTGMGSPSVPASTPVNVSQNITQR